jgi:peptidoglycan/LPS O-acetylase OafA/YrhL
MLDGLRGVAAIAVVIYHYSQNFGWELAPNAYLAVDFFFLLSGFVLAHAYQARLQAGQFSGAFMQRRLIRLYPLYWLGTTLAAVPIIAAALLGTAHPGAMRTLASYFLGVVFLPTPAHLSVFNIRVFPLDVPAWSLSLEVGVNALYAFVGRRLTTRRLAAIVLVAAMGLIVAAHHFQTMQLGHNWPTYLGGWIRVFWSFFAGVLAHRIFADGRPTLPTFVGVLITLLMIAVFAYRDDGALVGVVSALVLFPAILWIGAQVRLSGAARRLASWLGALSYALYIVHEPIWDALWLLCRLNHRDPRVAFWPSLLGWTLLALACASILNFAYDLPVRAFLTRKLAPRRRGDRMLGPTLPAAIAAAVRSNPKAIGAAQGASENSDDIDVNDEIRLTVRPVDVE